MIFLHFHFRLCSGKLSSSIANIWLTTSVQGASNLEENTIKLAKYVIHHHLKRWTGGRVVNIHTQNKKFQYVTCTKIYQGN